MSKYPDLTRPMYLPLMLEVIAMLIFVVCVV
jgi:hypothetical protein